jgi:hypothetical protein
MKIEMECQLLKVAKYDYVFGDRKGTSYKARILSSGLVFKCNTDQGVYDEYKDSEEVKGEAVLQLEPIQLQVQNSDGKVSRREVCQLTLSGFKSE